MENPRVLQAFEFLHTNDRKPYGIGSRIAL